MVAVAFRRLPYLLPGFEFFKGRAGTLDDEVVDVEAAHLPAIVVAGPRLVLQPQEESEPDTTPAPASPPPSSARMTSIARRR